MVQVVRCHMADSFSGQTPTIKVVSLKIKELDGLILNN